VVLGEGGWLGGSLFGVGYWRFGGGLVGGVGVVGFWFGRAVHCLKWLESGVLSVHVLSVVVGLVGV